MQNGELRLAGEDHRSRTYVKTTILMRGCRAAACKVKKVQESPPLSGLYFVISKLHSLSEAGVSTLHIGSSGSSSSGGSSG
jgi:hypothetical protein